MLWRMNIQVTRKKLSTTNKSNGLQYVRELIVKRKENNGKSFEKSWTSFAAISFHRHSGLTKSNDRDLFGVLNDDANWVNTRLFESKPGIIKFVDKSTHQHTHNDIYIYRFQTLQSRSTVYRPDI